MKIMIDECTMVWYDMVWYGMFWCGMVWYGMEWYGMEWQHICIPNVNRMQIFDCL